MKNISLSRSLLYILLIGTLALASCKPVTPGANPVPTETQPAPAPTQPSPTKQPQSTPTDTQMAAVSAAVQVLAKELNIDPSLISVVSYGSQDWPDGCLGLPQPDEQCTAAIVPGLGGILLANGQQYGFRADEAGKNARIIPGAVFAAMNLLAQKAGVKPENIGIVTIEKVEWPDACMGVTVEGQMCAQVITPGYRVVLQVNGSQYEYHTDEGGGMVAPANVPAGQTDQSVVVWTQIINEKCVSASIGMDNVLYGTCDGQKSSAPLSEYRKAELSRLVEKFASFESATVVGKITFAGHGQVTATSVQQRALAEWALLVDQESEAGRDSAAQSLAFSWHREGGIAGFCDDVTVYLTGFANVSSCKSNQPQNLGSYLLTSQDLHQLYFLLQQYQRFETKDKDTATADSMTIKIVFEGTGNLETSPVEKGNLTTLASQLVAQANTLQSPEDIASALQTLQTYFSLLGSGEYAKAAELYGGSYEVLTSNNPSISPNDHEGLFKNACTINGHQCKLTIQAVADQAQISSVDFRFSLEFQNPDGSLFSLGPCCGVTEQDMPTQTQFDFHVNKVDGKFLVMDLPVYVP